MFVDLRRLDGEQNIDTDICIAGGGPAGISIAEAFAGSRVRVCLIESGDLTADSANQDLADGRMISHPQHDLRTSRDRRFGGSTNSWAGACAPMSESDFDARPWIDADGWPFSRDALDPFFERAQELLELGDNRYDPDYWAADDLQFLDLDPAKLENRIWQLSPRVNFGRKYHQALDRSSNTSVLLNATVTELVTNERADVVRELRARSLNGRSATVRAKVFVLACGAIDNARVLLLSRRHTPEGLGNRHDLVGRYFMQHPHVSAASFREAGPKGWSRGYKDVRRGDLWLRARIGLSPEAQRRLRVLNGVASLIDRFITDSMTHRQSIGYVSVKQILLDLRHGRVPVNLGTELKAIAGDLGGLAVGFCRHLRRQNGALYIMAEQFPNPESRVFLGTEKDALGLEKTIVDWRLLPIDKRSILALVEEIRDEFQRLGIGEVRPDDWLTVDDQSWPLSLAGGHHHMGTTRMSDDPRKGVVDADAKAHGIDNLYIAGSSIFPTVGCANPTLTLLATSLRLAGHLKERLASSRPPSLVA